MDTINLETLVTILRENKNEINKYPMEKYMKNKFVFLGIKTPERKNLCKEYFKYIKKQDFSWNIFNFLWRQNEREFQYIAIDYLKLMKNEINKNDLDTIKKYILDKSWWDSVDAFHIIVNHLGLKYNIYDEMIEWSLNINFWLRRMSIIHQLHRKEDTDINLLEKTIKNNLNSNEFFINKAIGWALRDYSKTNSKWTKNFIDLNKDNLNKLSIKEGSKYL